MALKSDKFGQKVLFFKKSTYYFSCCQPPEFEEEKSEYRPLTVRIPSPLGLKAWGNVNFRNLGSRIQALRIG